MGQIGGQLHPCQSMLVGMYLHNMDLMENRYNYALAIKWNDRAYELSHLQSWQIQNTSMRTPQSIGGVTPFWFSSGQFPISLLFVSVNRKCKLPGSAGLIPRTYKQHNHSLRLITSKVAVSISFIYLLWGGVVHRSPHKQIYVFTEASAMVRLRDILCRFGSKEVCFGVSKPPKWIQSVLEDAKLQIWFASYPDLLSQVGIHLL